MAWRMLFDHGFQGVKIDRMYLASTSEEKISKMDWPIKGFPE